MEFNCLHLHCNKGYLFLWLFVLEGTADSPDLVRLGAFSGFDWVLGFLSFLLAMAAVAGSDGAKIDLEMSGELPIVDLNAFLNRDKGGEAETKARMECNRVAEALHKYGILIARDPRVTEEDNNEFLDMLEKYFEQDESNLREDVREEYSYQVRLPITSTSGRFLEAIESPPLCLLSFCVLYRSNTGRCYSFRD